MTIEPIIQNHNPMEKQKKVGMSEKNKLRCKIFKPKYIFHPEKA